MICDVFALDTPCEQPNFLSCKLLWHFLSGNCSCCASCWPSPPTKTWPTRRTANAGRTSSRRNWKTPEVTTAEGQKTTGFSAATTKNRRFVDAWWTGRRSVWTWGRRIVWAWTLGRENGARTRTSSRSTSRIIQGTARKTKIRREKCLCNLVGRRAGIKLIVRYLWVFNWGSKGRRFVNVWLMVK